MQVSLCVSPQNGAIKIWARIMSKDNTIKSFLTSVHPTERLALTEGGELCRATIPLSDRALVLLGRLPVISKLRVVCHASERIEGANRRVVQAFVGQLERIYPGSPIPRDVTQKYLRKYRLKLKAARGVDPQLLADINQEVHAYQAILALSSSPELDRTLSQQLAICRGSSDSQGLARF